MFDYAEREARSEELLPLYLTAVMTMLLFTLRFAHHMLLSPLRDKADFLRSLIPQRAGSFAHDQIPLADAITNTQGLELGQRF